jgi:hypothetical protein
MKKILTIAAIAAAGVGAYIFNQQQSSSPSYNVLDYVPADTALFSAQLEPFPLQDYLSSVPVNANEQQLLDELYKENNPKLNFFLNIFKTYQQGLKNPEQLLKTFGLPAKLRAYFYTLGLLPVFKAEVANPQAVWELLDKNEQQTGFTHRKGTIQSLNYRAYPLTEKDDPGQLELIIAIDKGLLTVALNSAFNDQSLLASALGLTKVKHPLSASGKIEEIINRHQFKAAGIGFINHIEIIKGLTTINANQLARQISKLEKLYQQESPFAAIRNAQCESEFAGIAANWPRTVFGYTGLDVNTNESTQEVAAIIESKNQTILGALQAIRGYIPKYTENIQENVLAMGLGLNIEQLSISLTDIWRDLQAPSYSCPPLAQLQNEIDQYGSSIGMLGMGMSMANDIKGVSIGIFDYTLGQINNEPVVENLDAIFTLSAENPQQIFDSLKMFSTELQQVQLTENSMPIDLQTITPLPAQLNLSPKLAIKGKHLLIYNGEKGEQAAEALSLEPLSANGLYHLSLDLQKIFTPVVKAVELSGETMPEELLFLSDYDSRMKMSFDINQQGLIFNSYVNNKSKK